MSSASKDEKVRLLRVRRSFRSTSDKKKFRHLATRRSRAHSIKIIRGSFNDDFAVHTGLKMSGKEADVFELASHLPYRAS
jgi:hypothetical protein